jgi:4-amino-4-deoxy-L-arabinose transferase-like glycosyltransferase
MPDPRPPARLSTRHERSLYVAAGTLLLSGIGWITAHYVLAGNSLIAGFKLEGAPHPSELWWLRLHGASMIGFLVVFGALLPGHVARGWQRRRNRRSGIFMVATTVVLAFSGYGLYYLGDEATRPWISVVHWVIGLAAGAGLVLHVTFGRRGVRRIAV